MLHRLGMAKSKTLENLFLDTLKNIYYAEKKILKALTKMRATASPLGARSARRLRLFWTRAIPSSRSTRLPALYAGEYSHMMSHATRSLRPATPLT